MKGGEGHPDILRPDAEEFADANNDGLSFALVTALTGKSGSGQGADSGDKSRSSRDFTSRGSA